MFVPEIKFPQTVQSNPNLQTAIKVVTQAHSGLVNVNPQNTIIESHPSTDLITLVYDQNGDSERIVIVVDENGNASIVEDVTVTGGITNGGDKQVCVNM